MEQFWFPLRNDSNCEHLLVENVVFLMADGNYTRVVYLDPQGQEQSSLQSGNIGKFEEILNHGFIRLRRNVIVNRSMVVMHGTNRTVTMSTGASFSVPKEKWTEVKTLLNMQLLLPMTKSADSLNEKGDSSTQ